MDIVKDTLNMTAIAQTKRFDMQNQTESGCLFPDKEIIVKVKSQPTAWVKSSPATHQTGDWQQRYIKKYEN